MKSWASLFLAPARNAFFHRGCAAAVPAAAHSVPTCPGVGSGAAPDRDTTIAAIANSARNASRWPPITSSTMSSGLATHSRTARTGFAAVRSST